MFFLIFAVQKNVLASSSHVDIVEVAPGIFVHQGKHFDVDESYQGDIGNIGFIIGKNSVAVIDTGGTLAIGKSLKASIREKTSLPIKYVINTHVHLDHIYGNAAFNDKNTKFIGHNKLPEAMQFRKEFYERFETENPTLFIDVIISFSSMFLPPIKACPLSRSIDTSSTP